MGTLVSPGTSVPITDDSFYIPVSSPTVPLYFIATADDKTQINGNTIAQGTTEHNVVRTITSLKQNLDLYGLPNFLREPGTLKEMHGDARNEYGLFAINQFLGIGNRAYVVRANVNLNDNIDDLRQLWDTKILEGKVILENAINTFIIEYNLANNLIPANAAYKTTVTAVELLTLVDASTRHLFDAIEGSFSFIPTKNHFMQDQSATPLLVYASGYGAATTGNYYGVVHIANNIATFPAFPGGSTVASEFTAQEGGDLLVALADDYKFTQEFLNDTSLGENDGARRVAITTALQAAVNSNTDVRSESFDYNLVLCPGYHEVADELLALTVDLEDEVLAVCDTPVNKSPEEISNPATGWAKTVERQNSTNIAYYYPWNLASNLDGRNVVVSPAGTAVRTYAYSDDVSYLWFAPAGLRRGMVSGISDVGYVTGNLGGPTKFKHAGLNKGQQGALYQDAPSGRINSIIYKEGKGFVVWGQKTSSPSPSAMDRVNVSRLMKYIKRQLGRNTLPFVFEPNDKLTRDNLKAVVDGFLGDLMVKRGLYDFVTLCDDSNNTPDRIDRNELYIDVAVKPVKAAEFIYIPIRILNTGASLTA